jgi:D-3-phosphoglycerate dehydrogenase
MRCLLVQPIHEAGRARLESAGIFTEYAPSTKMSDLAREIHIYDAVITRDAGLSAAVIAAAMRLRVIVSHGRGVDTIAIGEATRHGILVANTPGTNARSVAELAVGLALAAARQVPAADQSVRAGDRKFRERHRFIELAKRRVLIVGWGAIGQVTAAIFRDGFGMPILVFSPRADPEAVAASGGRKVASLREGLAQAELISLHAPLRADTKNLLDARALEAVAPGAIVINTARAGLIDESALIVALDTGKVVAAGLDVFDPDGLLMQRPEVILTPHLGGSTDDSLKRTALASADCVIAVLRGHIPATALNAEQVLHARARERE